jgi:hypothetical protein
MTGRWLMVRTWVVEANTVSEAWAAAVGAPWGPAGVA